MCFVMSSALLCMSTDMISYEFDRKDVLCLGISTLAGVWYLWKKVCFHQNYFPHLSLHLSREQFVTIELSVQTHTGHVTSDGVSR